MPAAAAMNRVRLAASPPGERFPWCIRCASARSDRAPSLPPWNSAIAPAHRPPGRSESARSLQGRAGREQAGRERGVPAELAQMRCRQGPTGMPAEMLEAGDDKPTSKPRAEADPKHLGLV